MKKLLKLYKMFYRLLRLKAWQRREIEIHNRSATVRILNSAYNEYFAVKTELNDYKQVMLQYRINSPLELLKVLEGSLIVCNESKTELQALIDLLEPQYRSQTTIKPLSENKMTKIEQDTLEIIQEYLPRIALALEKIANNQTKKETEQCTSK